MSVLSCCAGDLDDRVQEKLETKVWDPDNQLKDQQIDQFLVVARYVDHTKSCPLRRNTGSMEVLWSAAGWIWSLLRRASWFLELKLPSDRKWVIKA